MNKLKTLLDEIGPGEVPKQRRAEVIDHLKDVWNILGVPDVALYEYKLDRVESLEWDPPVLRFKIERHGGTVLGSSRAEMQEWEINLDTGEASYDETGHRQLHTQQSPWKADESAKEIAEAISNGKDDSRLKWLSERKVQVLTREFVPDGAKQTVQGRRRRFYKALDKHLEAGRWTRSGSYCYWEDEDEG